MRTRNLTRAVSVFLTIVYLTSATAQAGLLDWFIGNHAKADEASSGSFDSLYASILGTNVSANSGPVVTDTTMVTAMTPTGATVPVLHKFYTVQVSGYNSEVAQTDDNPFITASGTHVRDGVVATNMFPFGTAIKIPSLYGNKIFVVEDRMNSRYQNNVDIWFADKTEALKLGRRTIQIEVIK